MSESRSNLTTRDGWLSMKAELDQLWRVERRIVTQAVSDAAKLGDRSENADYIYGKRRLREIDRRVRYLRKRLEDAKVVDYRPEQEGKVFFGAYVELEGVNGEISRLRIVGSDEIDPRKGYISIDSPVARALIGKTVDTEVEVETPTGVVYWTINSIQYPLIQKPQ